MEYWAKPGLDRLQALLFYPTLDESISQDHPVRASEEILRELDWSAWVQEYNGHVGQPPIPPWVMAGVILYGLIRRIRSSRQLEYACGNNFDFIYDAEANCYYCPLGRVLGFEQTKREKGRETRYVYRCKDCEGRPLAGICRDPNSQRGRSISRDEHEPLRERMHAKMQTEAARTTYNRRMHIGETPFAIIKNIFEVRRFLLRGLEKVRTEWRWVCTAYNLKKLMTLIAALRAEGKEITVNAKG